MIRSIAVALIVALAGCGASPAPLPGGALAGAARPPAHPLEPLTHDEVDAAMRLLRAAGHFPEGVRLLSLSLREPPKEEVRAFRPGSPFRREAIAIVLNHPRGEVDEAVIDLAAHRVASWRPIEGLEPWPLDNDLQELPDRVRADPRWQDAMRKRGITDWKNVEIDCWTSDVVSAEADGSHPIRVLSWYVGGERGPFHCRPIEGVTVILDPKTRRILRVQDTGVRRVAAHLYDFARAADPSRAGPAGEAQAAPAPFTLEGNEVRWRGWSFRVSMQPREGLVLHTVAIDDGGTTRSILYRASISELLVPYADPDPNWSWRSIFDVGEDGLGYEILSLEAGRDVPAGARFLGATFADPRGDLMEVPRSIAIYERDGGLLWKHHDARTGEELVRSGRELVVKSFACLGNYDYGFDWIFAEDGSITMQVEVTGMLLVKGVDRTACGACDALEAGTATPTASPGNDGARQAGPEERFGTLVDQGIVAPNHQHFINARLDFDVDGEANSIAELDARPAPEAAGSLSGNAWVYEERVLRDEAEAQREVSEATHRAWRIFNPHSRSTLGHVRSYMLVPSDPIFPYMGPDARVRRQAGFIEKQLVATRLRPEEQQAAGSYPGRLVGQNGLPRFSADGEPLVAQDLVVWHTFGVTHHPRPEDWPVMPITRVGFRLVPDGFFDRNPAFVIPR